MQLPSDTDEIINFDADNDILDISELLIDYDGNLSQFVELEDAGGSTIVRVDSNGGGDNFQELVTLQGVDVNTLFPNFNIEV